MYACEKENTTEQIAEARMLSRAAVISVEKKLLAQGSGDEVQASSELPSTAKAS